MTRRTVLLAGLILFAVSGIVIGTILYLRTIPAPAKTETSGETAALSAGSYSEHTGSYDIAANYPTTTPLLASVGAAENDSAIALMRNFVGGTVSTFKAGFTSNTYGAGTPAQPSDGKGSLQIVYLIGSSAHTVSYIFTIYEDTGGAHPFSYFKTFAFDTKTGAALSLADIFLPGASYLDRLSSISRSELPGIIGPGADTQFIQNGTTPEEKNFENFFFDNSDFVILFPTYQVAPYALGPQTLRIKTETLSDILKPEYR